MRLNVSRGSRFLVLIYVLCLFVFVFDLVIINIDGSWSSVTKLSPFALVILVVISYRGLPQFLYDSDGEVLNFTAREPNLAFLSQQFVKHIEFPKRKLSHYVIRRYPLRRKLVLYIRSKDNHLVRQAISISYLKRRELADLKISLDRVMAANHKRRDGRTTR